MKVPGGRYQPPRPPKPPAFDPYLAIAAAMLQERTVPIVPAMSEPRDTAPVSQPEPPPEPETAEVVDLGEERAKRQPPPEVDKHAELMGKLSTIDEVYESMNKLAKQFEAANDGSIQGAVSDGINSVNTLVKDMKNSIANSVKQALAKQEQAFKDGIESSKGLLSQQTAKIDAIRDQDLGKLNDSLSGFNDRIKGLNDSLEGLQNLLKAPKRIVRDAKGRAIGSVVDPNLRG